MRAVHLFADFAEDQELAAFRHAHDSLASCIPPHITLVFPFESEMGDDELVAHVRRACADLAPFAVTLGPAECQDHGIIWLPVQAGVREVTVLHERLYTGPLAVHRDPRFMYVPHVTIARVVVPALPGVHRAAMELPAASPAEMREVVVECIGEDDQSHVIARIPLARIC